MEQELYNEWRLFEKRSLKLLKNSKIRQTHNRRILKIIKTPSLYWDCVRRWEVYDDLVIRIDWFCQDDYKKFDTITERENHPKFIAPTIKFKLLKIEKSYTASIQNELSNISIPITVRRDFLGCDGTDYELELGDYMSVIKLNWWENGPASWKSVDDLTKRIISDIDNILEGEEYISTLNFEGSLWLEPSSNIKITKDLFIFLKQLPVFSRINALKVAEIFKNERPVLLHANYDFERYIEIKSEFDKFGLKVEFIFD